MTEAYQTSHAAVGSEKQEKNKSLEALKEQAVATAAVGMKRAGQFSSDKQPDPKRKRT